MVDDGALNRGGLPFEWPTSLNDLPIHKTYLPERVPYINSQNADAPSLALECSERSDVDVRRNDSRPVSKRPVARFVMVNTICRTARASEFRCCAPTNQYAAHKAQSSSSVKSMGSRSSTVCWRAFSIASIRSLER